ncbi:MAG: hypothetical protein LM550_04040 [Candidatus Contendobacter sp.]|jgi:hypothetical protein|nr:hypothetical protein [Gammaproteobacteria bacterium]MCC8992858.1 hypothetical protein [Candidatus Contendobacter sp.]
MKPFRLIVSGLALCLAQSLSPALASDESYGCCLIKTEDNAANIWEYENDVPFVDCYRSAKLIGNPFEFLRDRKYEFYTGKKCSSLPTQHELIPVQWGLEYRTG